MISVIMSSKHKVDTAERSLSLFHEQLSLGGSFPLGREPDVQCVNQNLLLH